LWHLRIILQHLFHIPSFSALFNLCRLTQSSHYFSLCLFYSSTSKTNINNLYPTYFTIFLSKIWYVYFQIFFYHAFFFLQFFILDVLWGTQLGLHIKFSNFMFWVQLGVFMIFFLGLSCVDGKIYDALVFDSIN
jgi:hypothetical protein